jgi:protein phosphatase
MTDVASDLHHILTDALGAGAVDPHIDVERITVADGDIVLVCSNGLTDAVDDKDIAAMLGSRKPVRDICDDLVARAFKNGTVDDVTALVARYHIPE